MIGFCVVIVIILLNVLAYNHARCMVKFSGSGALTKTIDHLSLKDKINIVFKGVCVPRPENMRTPEAVGLSFEEHTIQSDPGVTLHGWLMPAENSRDLAVIYHGYCREKSSMLEPARLLHDAGWNVALIDFRGSGLSTGCSTSIGYHEGVDVVKSFEYFKNILSPEKTLIIGHSMGAAAVLKAFHDGMDEPDLLIIEAVFDRMIQTTRTRFQEMNIPTFPVSELLVFWGGVQVGFNAFRHNPVEYAESVTCPTLFLHGEKDHRALPEDARKVANAVQGSSQFYLFPDGAHHVYAAHFPELWTQQVLSFATP